MYGSRAIGNYTAGSDIDLTLIGNSLTLEDMYRLEDCLEDLLLPYRFDISLHHQIDNLNLIEHIRQVGIIFYQTKKAMSTY